MSTITKKPYIHLVLESLTEEQLIALKTIINTESKNASFKSIINPAYFISVADKGVNRTVFEAKDNVYTGAFVYNDDYCVLISWESETTQKLKMCVIDPEEKSYYVVEEPLTINELRRIVDVRLLEIQQGGDATKFASIHEYEEGTVLTATILGQLKSGDIIKVGNAEFVIDIQVEEETHTITGKMIGSASSDSLSIADLEWTEGEELQPSMVNFSGGGGLPAATKEGQVIVSNAQNEPSWANSAPWAENLVASPEINDAMYSSGPTGGLADIATGQEAYLQDVKGMTIIWNQLLDVEHSSVTLKSSHIYAVFTSNGYYKWTFYQNSTSTISYEQNVTKKVYDLTLMFGGNNKIPFSLSAGTEYPANGTVPSQMAYPVGRFLRLFANVDLFNAPYDAGTPKNVKASTLVETGRNLWDASTMETNGLKLLANYRYEVYLNANYNTVQVSEDGGATWHNSTLQRGQNSAGKYVWYIDNSGAFANNILIKSVSSSYPIAYVGFIHSGNYCLTTGTVNNASYAKTDITIPAYKKYEFNISGIDGLNGLVNSSGEIACADTKDYTRVGIVDLSTLSWTAGSGTFSASVTGIKQSTDLLLASKYIGSEMSVDAQGVITITSAESPTGSLYFELETPVSTGHNPFEPIALKDAYGWIVDDMGSEYFIQPANTNCPVNQVSYYYPNLKDKLVNIQEPIEVVALNYFTYSDTSLPGIQIGLGKYKLAPVGEVGHSYAISIGTSSRATSQYSASFGYSARATGNRATSIGAESVADKTGGIALGAGARNTLPNCLVIDSTSTNRKYQAKTPAEIMFRFEDINQFANAEDAYIYKHYLSEFVQNNALVEEGGKYYVSYTNSTNYVTFSKSYYNGNATDISRGFTGLHLVLKLSNNVVASLDLLPYDDANTQAFTAYGLASDTPTFVSAYVDADGCVIITAPSGITIVEAKYNLR